MKGKKTFIISLLLMLATATWAQTAKQLVVWQKSGEKTYIDMSEMPETTFEDGLLVISTSKSTVQFQLDNVLRYTYTGYVATGIDLLPTERMINIAKEGDSVTLSNLREGTTVGIYSANGTLLEQHTTKGGQPLYLSVSQRPAGVYIVKAGKETIKLMRP